MNMEIAVNSVKTVNPQAMMQLIIIKGLKYSPLILTCEPFEHGNILETLEVVNEHIGDPEIIEKLQGHGIPELRLHRVVCPDSEAKRKR